MTMNVDQTTRFDHVADLVTRRVLTGISNSDGHLKEALTVTAICLLEDLGKRRDDLDEDVLYARTTAFNDAQTAYHAENIGETVAALRRYWSI